MKIELFNDTYVGAMLDDDLVKHIVNEWFSVSLDAKIFHANKTARDGTSKLHVTIIEPGELRTLSKAGVSVPVGSVADDLVFGGVGTVSDAHGNITAFITAQSDLFAAYRESLGLGLKDFHATLGFNRRDVYNVPKNVNNVFEIQTVNTRGL